ncbi:NADH dehydrogenase [ubiquinone] 1 alpha subcomplex assembly factor 3 [Bombus vancouverensis nearcticus]|uniref:NADH dehydrogenase [ubiquinone] 1 alpha subcomplex assembly factor 3 n=1 Tax=Bombus vancouverensis nearcticus TaxID=2705178 RepID=UPI0014388A78|nr:NADH dehydrogenase [ubiquinone] 1 alpha subcomplex assembly factor 3 [Bombus vancouverensis nearcticus]
MVLTKTFPILKRLLQNTKQFHTSRTSKEYDGPGKTTIDIINNQNIPETRRFLINKCLPIGFKLNDNSLLLGPIVIFDGMILSWNIRSAKDINEATLSLFTIVHPELDLIVLGLETNYEYNRILEIKKVLLKYNIRSEILPVRQACGVYNFLVSDGRYIAAGLIPPLPDKSNLYCGLQRLPTKKRELIDK